VLSVALITLGCPLGLLHDGFGMKALPIISIRFRMAYLTLHTISGLVFPGRVSIISDLSVTI
jgi:hypothetical protein